MRFVVSGRSMEPAYFSGDKLFASGIIYKLRKPKTGDVVVLRDPRSERLVLKRIRKIDGGKYFVVGDNEGRSTDSRKFGAVPRGSIVGRVCFKYSG